MFFADLESNPRIVLSVPQFTSYAYLGGWVSTLSCSDSVLHAKSQQDVASLFSFMCSPTPLTLSSLCRGGGSRAGAGGRARAGAVRLPLVPRHAVTGQGGSAGAGGGAPEPRPLRDRSESKGCPWRAGSFRPQVTPGIVGSLERLSGGVESCTGLRRSRLKKKNILDRGTRKGKGRSWDLVSSRKERSIFR